MAISPTMHQSTVLSRLFFLNKNMLNNVEVCQPVSYLLASLSNVRLTLESNSIFL